MSTLEIFATIFNILGVYLMVKKNILTWPVGLVGVVLLGILFYQLALYADFFEQIYFFITGVYGWILWKKKEDPPKNNPLKITTLSTLSRILILAVFSLTSFVLAYVDSNLFLWFPKLFTQPAAYPFWDSSTTAASFIANLLNAHKKMEAWILWIYVNVVGIILYIQKEVYLITSLYLVFFVLALKGFNEWKKSKSEVLPNDS